MVCDCPPGWNNEDDSCYSDMSPSKVNYDTAKSDCEANGGYVAVPNDANELDNLDDAFPTG